MQQAAAASTPSPRMASRLALALTSAMCSGNSQG